MEAKVQRQEPTGESWEQLERLGQRRAEWGISVSITALAHHCQSLEAVR